MLKNEVKYERKKIRHRNTRGEKRNMKNFVESERRKRKQKKISKE